jgi:ribonucleoside-diphosphate reductase alpha chain
MTEEKMKTLSDLIVRRFTKELENNPDKTVYDLFEWKTVDVLIKDHANNKVVCDMKGLEFPFIILRMPAIS